jgi:hypothetical protein
MPAGTVDRHLSIPGRRSRHGYGSNTDTLEGAPHATFTDQTGVPRCGHYDSTTRRQSNVSEGGGDNAGSKVTQPNRERMVGWSQVSELSAIF